MMVPRRRPRVVYEVYDAEERLDEHAGLDGAVEPDFESGQIDDPPHGSAAADAGLRSPVSPVRRPFAPQRALAGAALCAAAVCVLTSIAVVLMHLLAGGASDRPGAPSATRPRTQMAARTDHSAAPASQASSVQASKPPGRRRAAASRNLASRRRTAPSATREPSSSPVPVPDASFPSPARTLPAAFIAAIAYPSVQRFAPACSCVAAEAEFGFER